ncbi:uncharacterized protein KY384_000495 [Bacidia gigantensis]|uniref:uncharacterized protein n=1 Tax=Bacidia gigantensis TaxID=2732470 RepID=UPI001D03723A|nr:uncharacterized protein KY384_000495 [Bacidia gigantensis]KAG8525735.1 hypothetical protein KY384_000495 [Bacidia gigantensis]
MAAESAPREVWLNVIGHLSYFDEVHHLKALYGLLLTNRSCSNAARRPLEKVLYSKYFEGLDIPPWNINYNPVEQSEFDYVDWKCRLLERCIIKIQRLPQQFRSSAIFRMTPDQPHKCLFMKSSKDYLKVNHERETLEELLSVPYGESILDLGRTQDQRRLFEADYFGDIVNGLLKANEGWTFRDTAVPLFQMLEQMCRYFRLEIIEGSDRLIFSRETYDIKAAEDKRRKANEKKLQEQEQQLEEKLRTERKSCIEKCSNSFIPSSPTAEDCDPKDEPSKSLQGKRKAGTNTKTFESFDHPEVSYKRRRHGCSLTLAIITPMKDAFGPESPTSEVSQSLENLKINPPVDGENNQCITNTATPSSSKAPDDLTDVSQLEKPHSPFIPSLRRSDSEDIQISPHSKVIPFLFDEDPEDLRTTYLLSLSKRQLFGILRNLHVEMERRMLIERLLSEPDSSGEESHETTINEVASLLTLQPKLRRKYNSMGHRGRDKYDLVDLTNRRLETMKTVQKPADDLQLQNVSISKIETSLLNRLRTFRAQRIPSRGNLAILFLYVTVFLYIVHNESSTGKLQARLYTSNMALQEAQELIQSNVGHHVESPLEHAETLVHSRAVITPVVPPSGQEEITLYPKAYNNDEAREMRMNEGY